MAIKNHSLSAAIHKGAYITATDPATTYPARMQTNVLWVDTASSPYVLKRRNDSNDGWVTLGILVPNGAISTFGFALIDDADAAAARATLGLGSAATKAAGSANGVAELDSGGKVPSAQLPSFVDDVLEYANFAALPGTGASGLLYVTLDDNKVFRWSGSAYVEVSPSGTPTGSAGGGLSGTYPNPSVNVDGTTIEVNSNALRVKDAGITPAKLSNAAKDFSVNFVIDGGGAAITTGSKGYVILDCVGTVLSATLLADQSGSIVVDVKKSNYSDFPTTASIAASAKPTLSAAQKSQDSTLTGWTTSLSAGDVLEFVVDSAATVQRILVSLKIRRG